VNEIKATDGLIEKRISEMAAVLIAVAFFCMSLFSQCQNLISDSNVAGYNSGWEYSYGEETGSVDLPAELSAPKDTVIILKKMLPERLSDSAGIVFRTRLQRVRIYIEGEMIYQYPSQKLIGDAVPSTWNFVKLSEEAAGKQIEIRLESPYSEFAGKIEEIRIGNYNELISDTVADQLPAFMLSLSIGILGALVLLLFRSSLLEKLGTDTLNGTITSETIEESNVVTMRVESPSAQDARAILDAALEIYPETARFVLGDIQFNYLDEPETPAEPYNQIGTLRSLALGGAGGAVIALVILGMSALFRRTARNSEEMKQITSLRCLAAVPHVRSKARKTHKNRILSVMEKRVPYGYRESIRALKVRLERAMKKNGGQILLITSTVSGEGKSTLAVNLAEMFAAKGSRVLFIDGDLRKQEDARMFGSRKGMGLAELVKGERPGRELLRKMKGKELYLLGGSRPVKQPAPILSSPKIEAFLGEMRKRMDYIIIDTPPCCMFQDAGILADQADGILYVVKYDEAPQREIRTGFLSLSGKNAPFLGYVFNDYPESVSEYGYGRYGYENYGYRKYGYGHGYGEYSEKQMGEGTE